MTEPYSPRDYEQDNQVYRVQHSCGNCNDNHNERNEGKDIGGGKAELAVAEKPGKSHLVGCRVTLHVDERVGKQDVEHQQSYGNGNEADACIYASCGRVIYSPHQQRAENKSYHHFSEPAEGQLERRSGVEHPEKCAGGGNCQNDPTSLCPSKTATYGTIDEDAKPQVRAIPPNVAMAAAALRGVSLPSVKYGYFTLIALNP